jgi:hypothetical protein
VHENQRSLVRVVHLLVGRIGDAPFFHLGSMLRSTFSAIFGDFRRKIGAFRIR